MSTTIAYRGEYGSLIVQNVDFGAAFSYFGNGPSKVTAETEFILSQVKLRQNPEVQDVQD